MPNSLSLIARAACHNSCNSHLAAAPPASRFNACPQTGPPSSEENPGRSDQKTALEPCAERTSRKAAQYQCAAGMAGFGLDDFGFYLLSARILATCREGE